MARKDLMLQRAFPNRFLCGENDVVDISYRSSKGYPTLEAALTAVGPFSDSGNFFFVCFRKTWYPVFVLLQTSLIVLGKSFVAYSEAAAYGDGFAPMLYKEKGIGNIDYAEARAILNTPLCISSTCGYCPDNSPFIEDLKGLNNGEAPTVYAGKNISPLMKGREAENFVLNAFGYAMFTASIPTFQLDGVRDYFPPSFLSKNVVDSLWLNGYDTFQPVTREKTLAANRRSAVIWNHAYRVYSLKDWVSGHEHREATADRQCDAWL